MSKTILPEKKLNDSLKEVFIKEVNNDTLLDALNKKFTKKNLNNKTIACLFDETKEVEDLNLIEKIAITETIYALKKDEKFNVDLYYSDNDLMDYEGFVNHEKKIKDIEINNCIRIDDENYRGIISARQVYDYMNGMLIRYNKDTQRATKLKKIGTSDTYTRKISLNKKAVNEIAGLILANEFEESEIILNVRAIKGKTPQLIFEEKQGNIGDLLITPNYDRSSKMTTYVEILDGFHRLNGYYNAVKMHYDKTGEWLDRKLGVKIVVADYERAMRIISQVFKRTDTNKQFLKAIEKNDINKFADKLIEKSKVLNNNVTNDYSECIALGKRTHKMAISGAIEKLDINVTDIAVVTFKTKEMANYIDLLIKLIESRIEGKEAYNHLLSPNMFILYTRLAYNLSESENPEDLIMKYLAELMTTNIPSSATKQKYNFNEIFNLIEV